MTWKSWFIVQYIKTKSNLASSLCYSSIEDSILNQAFLNKDFMSYLIVLYCTNTKKNSVILAFKNLQNHRLS